MGRLSTVICKKNTIKKSNANGKLDSYGCLYKNMKSFILAPTEVQH